MATPYPAAEGSVTAADQAGPKNLGPPHIGGRGANHNRPAEPQPAGKAFPAQPPLTWPAGGAAMITGTP
jgi:hypothetical protein